MMKKTVYLTVVQKTLSDTFYNEGKPQKVISERADCLQCAVKNISKQKNLWEAGWKCKVWYEKVHKPQG